MVAAGSKRRRQGLVHKTPPKLDSVRNEINVTPFVDVCLVLLIIFMVILPMLTRGKDVPVPEAYHLIQDKDQRKEKYKDTREPIVAIDEYGKLWVDRDPAQNFDELKTMVDDEWKALAAVNEATQAEDRRGEGRVLIKAHPRLRYKQVLPVIMALHELNEGVGIDLGVNEAKEAKEE